MKNRKICKLISVILALLLLASCAPKNAGSGSSVLTESENQNIVSSEISKDETSSQPSTSSKDEGNSSPVPVRPTVSSKEEKPTSSKESTSSEPTSTKPILPYRMPEDNPAPIYISGASAATPTPISYTDTPTGEYVEYGCITTSSSSSALGTKTHVATIRTYDELCELYEWDKSQKKWTGEDYTEKLSKGIFNHSVVFVLLRCRGNLDTKIGNVQVTKRNGQLCIHQKLIRDGRLGAAGYDRQFIIVSKSELENVNSVVLYYDISILSQEYFSYDIASYDMSYSGEKGKKIFEDNSEKITGFTKFPIVRIDSRDELLEFADKIYPYFNFNSASQYNKCFNDLIKKCDKEFFSKQTLFMMYITTGSSAVDYSIMGVGKKGNALAIDIYYDNHGIGADVMSAWVTTVEIDKETAKSINAIDITLTKI